MANTKLQFKYGQWSRGEAVEMSKLAGVVVYSGLTRGIYVDGKEFVSGEGSEKDIKNLISLLGAELNSETGLYELGLEGLPEGISKDVTSVLNNLVERMTEIEGFHTNMHVDGYAQAEIEIVEGEVPANNSTKLTILGIGQGTEGAENDGKIYNAEANNLVVNIAGIYNGEDNKIATESTVSTAISSLRAEILGTLDPEELDKTIDTIKEIQEMLKGGNFVEWTHEVVNPETGLTETKIENVRVEPVTDEDGNVIGYKLPDIDEVEGMQVVTVNEDGTLSYAEGYNKLQETQNVEELLNDINNIESKELVAKIEVAENRVENFVTTETETETDENGLTVTNYTVGVNYGTFKTGHEEVHNADSQAFVNGIATVEDVQRYIEERMTWVEFHSSINEGIELPTETELVITTEKVVITLPENGTMTVNSPVSTDKPIVVR